MKRFVECRDRAQFMLLPECLDDFVGEDNPIPSCTTSLASSRASARLHDKLKKAGIADEVSADDMPCAMPLAVRARLPRGTTTEQCDGRYRRRPAANRAINRIMLVTLRGSRRRCKNDPHRQ